MLKPLPTWLGDDTRLWKKVIEKRQEWGIGKIEFHECENHGCATAGRQPHLPFGVASSVGFFNTVLDEFKRTHSELLAKNPYQYLDDVLYWWFTCITISRWCIIPMLSLFSHFNKIRCQLKKVAKRHKPKKEKVHIFRLVFFPKKWLDIFIPHKYSLKG